MGAWGGEEAEGAAESEETKNLGETRNILKRDKVLLSNI